MKNKTLIAIVCIMLTTILSLTVEAIDIIVKEIVSGLEYDGIGDFSDGMSIVWRNGKLGYINKMGKLVIPCVYDGANNFIDGVARVKINGKENYIDKTGRIIISFDYDEVGEFSDSMAWIRKGDKYGYIDKSGDLVIPIVLDCYFEYEDSTYAIIFDFSEGLAAISIDGKCGFIDKTGKLVIPAIYDGNFWVGEWWNYIPEFHDGIVRVRKDGKAGCIDKTGKIVIPFEYYWLGNGWTGYFREGLAYIDKYDEDGDRIGGLIDKNGNFVVPLGYYASISDFNGTLAFVVEDYTKSDKGAYIDKSGKVVTEFEYNADQWCWWYWLPSSEGMTIARKDGAFYFIDEKGNSIGPYSGINFFSKEFFSNGLAYVEYFDIIKDTYICGFIDKTGKLIISTNEYDDTARNFSDGLAWVKRGDKWGYINTAGELVVPLVYDEARDFSEGLAFVRKDDGWAILEIKDYSAIIISPETGNIFERVFLFFGFISSIIFVIAVKKKVKI